MGDISLSSAVPASLQTTTTRTTAAASNGDKLFCIEIKSAPAQSVHPERAAQIEEIQKTAGVMWKAAAHPRFASAAPGAFKDKWYLGRSQAVDRRWSCQWRTCGS